MFNRRSLALSLVLALLLGAFLEAAGPRTWGKTGTATVTNATLTVGGSSSFGPSSVCVQNEGATNDLYFDWTDGVATTTDNSTNVKVPPSTTICMSWRGATTNVVQIGVITSSSTTEYNIVAIAGS